MWESRRYSGRWQMRGPDAPRLPGAPERAVTAWLAVTNNAWLKTRTAALNLRNLIGRGLTRRDGTWLLAT